MICIELTERNQQIADRWRQGEQQKNIAAEFGLSAPRVRQILERELKRESRRLKISRNDLFDHYRPRKKGGEGNGYSSAATIEQRRALRKWEESAAAVEQAQRDVEQFGLGVKFDAIHSWEPSSDIVAKIAYIKNFYNHLTDENKERHKDRLAAKIDHLLAALRRRALY